MTQWGEIGSFYISQNTDTNLLLRDYYQATLKDIRWSLTISVDSNSSSAIKFTLFHNSSGISTITGEKEFITSPGQTRSVFYNHSYIYRSVVCSCEAIPINFYYELVEPTAEASGNFEILNTVYDTFPPPESKGNISAGLDGFNPLVSLLSFVLIITLFYKRKFLSE